MKPVFIVHSSNFTANVEGGLTIFCFSPTCGTYLKPTSARSVNDRSYPIGLEQTNRSLHHANLNKSLMTPMAVTAAPAPAPCTMSGLGLYRSVWNMMMLSDPPNEVANGCEVEYLRKIP